MFKFEFGVFPPFREGKVRRRLGAFKVEEVAAFLILSTSK